MKKYNFKNIFEIKWFFSFRRVKLVRISIPNNADDTHYCSSDKNVTYWIGPKKTTIDLPPHKEGEKLLLVPMYQNNVYPTVYNSNRYILIKLLY